MISFSLQVLVFFFHSLINLSEYKKKTLSLPRFTFKLTFRLTYHSATLSLSLSLSQCVIVHSMHLHEHLLLLFLEWTTFYLIQLNLGINFIQFTQNSCYDLSKLTIIDLLNVTSVQVRVRLWCDNYRTRLIFSHG